MPPLPTTIDDETLALISAVERRFKDLFDYQIPRLKDCKGPLAIQQTWATELREDAELLARQIEEFSVLTVDQNTEHERRELVRVTDEFKASLASLKRESRAAALTSKRFIDSQSLSQREELLHHSIPQEQHTGEKTAGNALMKANSEVTEALQRTITLMQGELERSVLSSQMLESSNATLRSSSSMHDTLTNVMDTSKQLITVLEKTDWMDRLLILSALVFFFLVVLFIFKQRVIDRGLRIALWWTRFLPSSSASGRQPAEPLHTTSDVNIHKDL